MHFIAVLMFCMLYINLSRGNFREEVFKLRLPGTRMSGGIVKLIPEVSFIKCAVLCAQSPSQVAFNYNAADGNCEIITKQHTSTSIQEDNNYNYYVLGSLSPCKSNLCAEGNVCFTSSDGISYECRGVVFVLPDKYGDGNENNADPCESNPCLEGKKCSVNSDGSNYDCFGATSTVSGTSDAEIPNKNNPCDPNPCFGGNECLATSDGMDYECLNCIYPSGIGKNCQEFVCGSSDHCFHSKDTLYVLFGGGMKPQVSWKDTFAKCSAAGLEMVTMKNESVEETLSSNLNSIFGITQIASYMFWIGLKRENSSTAWKWTDGSSLGKYQPWADDQPGKEELYVSVTAYPNVPINWFGDNNAPYENIWRSAFKYPAFCQAKITTKPEETFELKFP